MPTTPVARVPSTGKICYWQGVYRLAKTWTVTPTKSNHENPIGADMSYTPTGGIIRHEPSKIYSKVVEANGFVFTAGIVADDVTKDVLGQTQQILAEIDRILKLAGTDKTKVVSASIWLSDIRTRDAMNEAWNAWTGGKNLPGRACVEAKLADPRMLVEIGVVAVK
jgi:enamine deaminase RidA (YjgF/YER057c/UK114 family)